MKGKVLSSSLISGEDGNRYEFLTQDVQNLQNLSVESLVGKEVDFVVKDGKASEIFIVKSQVDDFLSSMKAGNLSSAKIKYYISVGCRFLSLIPYIGLFFGIAGFVVGLFAIIDMKKLSTSKNLLKNYLIFNFMWFIFVIALPILVLGIATQSYIAVTIGIIVLLLFLVIEFMAGLKFYNEMADITSQGLFKIVFWLFIIGVLTMPIMIGIILVLVGAVIEIIAWYKIEDVKNSSKEYKLF